MPASGAASQGPQSDAPACAFSIVLPAYNEGRRIARALHILRDFLDVFGRPTEIIVVDDGSRDDTLAAVHAVTEADGADEGRRRLGRHPLRILSRRENRGKGFAAREGVLAARGERVLICDVDLSTPIDELPRLSAWIDQGCDVVVGSRDVPDACVSARQPWPRWLLAVAFRWIRRRVMLPQIRDTQCGFKLFRLDAARSVFALVREERFLFDCEALGTADALGYRIAEVGVRWRHDRDSRVRVATECVTALPQLWRIARRVKRLRR